MGTHQLPVASQGRDPRSKGDTGETTIGTLLRAARESRGLTLEQIASETKIPKRHLEALERDDFDILPAGVYLRGEIRAFARVVHLNEDLVLARLQRKVVTQDPAPVAVAPPARPPVLTRERMLVGVGLIAIAAIAGYAVGRRGPSTPDPLPRVPAENIGPSQPLLPVSQVQSTTIGTSHRASTATPPSTIPDAAPAVAVTSGTPHEPNAFTRGGQLATGQASIPGAESQTRSTESQLIVTSQPPGARVTVNGIGWGTTPVTIRHLPPGDKRIRVSQDGYLASERVVSLAEGQQRKLAISMSPAP
jgi:cytoskeletal protein RodZ